jgi:hypothetical protein
MGFDTKLERELAKPQNQNDQVMAENFLGNVLGRAQDYDIVAFKDTSLRQGCSGTNVVVFPVYANRNFRVGSVRSDVHMNGMSEQLIEYYLVREGSDLITALYVKHPGVEK